VTAPIVILTEDALADADVAHLLSLHPDMTCTVLVPADTDQPLLATVLDDLGLGDVAGALRRVRGLEPTPTQARTTAHERLETSLARLREAGVAATGQITDDDPMPTLAASITDTDAREVVVITYPHLIEDTLRTDWASKARARLQVPVLHLYSGTSVLG